MPVVEFKVGKLSHEISCAEGEQQKIRQLATKLDKRVGVLSKALGGASDAKILAIAALMMEDEISALKAENKSGGKAIQQAGDISEEDVQHRVNEALIKSLGPLAETVERLAFDLKSA